MEEYVKEAEEVSKEEFFGESYDKEWALRDEMRREGKEERNQEIARAMINKGIDIEVIFECTGLSITEINELK